MLNFVVAVVRGSTRRVSRAGAAQLNSKRGPRNYYKGKGAKATGQHTSKGACSSALQLETVAEASLTAAVLQDVMRLTQRGFQTM